MIIGHLNFAAIMLIPAAAAVLLRTHEVPPRTRRLRDISDVLLVGVMFAYMVHSGFGSLMLPGILSLVGIGLIHAVCFGGSSRFWIRLSLSGLAGIALSLSKLTAASAFMANFSRSGYALPGAGSVSEALLLVIRSLFVNPAWDVDRASVLTNLQWALGRHEWEYSMTPVPLFVLAYGMWRLLVAVRKRPRGRAISPNTILALAGLSVILLIPIAINTFQLEWNRVLKTLPLLKTASTLVRWFMLYIPLVVVVTGVIFDRGALFGRRQWQWAGIGLAGILALNVLTARDYYHHQPYNPKPVVSAWHGISEGRIVPSIQAIGVTHAADGSVTLSLARNDMFINRVSPLFCYEPILGYRLEGLPIGPMRPGPALLGINGLLNLKNPACYVWPEANQCRPGDHFSVAQMDAAKKLLLYKPFPFQMSLAQRVANSINLLVMIVTGILLVACTIVRTDNNIQPNTARIR